MYLSLWLMRTTHFPAFLIIRVVPCLALANTSYFTFSLFHLDWIEIGLCFLFLFSWRAIAHGQKQSNTAEQLTLPLFMPKMTVQNKGIRLVI